MLLVHTCIWIIVQSIQHARVYNVAVVVPCNHRIFNRFTGAYEYEVLAVAQAEPIVKLMAIKCDRKTHMRFNLYYCPIFVESMVYTEPLFTKFSTKIT